MPFKAGQNVGAYRVVEQLGQGGMATVFKAYHAALDRFVALKVLHPAFNQDEGFLARFQREARVVAKLDHPKIVPVYDFAQHEGHPYLVMKFIEGETLKARLKQQPLTQDELLQVVDAVGEALSYAHAQGILHRDIKPSNVILSNEEQIYLTDFGLARIAGAGESTLSSDVILGTPQYISPEQAIGQTDLDEGADIYSLGVLLYELTVGKTPFSSDSPLSIVHDHIYTPLPSPSSLNPEIPKELEHVLLKALAKEREDRFADIPGLVAAFKRALDGKPPQDSSPHSAATRPLAEERPLPPLEPPATTTPSSATKPSRSRAESQAQPTRRRRWWVLVPLLLGACACAFVSLAVLSNLSEADAASTPAQQTLELAQADLAEHPQDPFAHLQVAAAYLDLGLEQEAIQAFEGGAQLAGENADYFFAAGEQLAARDLWLPAAQNYLLALKLGAGHLPADQLERVQEVFYRAAADPAAAELLSSLDQNADLGPLSLEFLQALRVRAIAHAERPRRDSPLFARFMERDAILPVSRLIKAETLLMLDEVGAAREILVELAREGRVAEWIRLEARLLLDQINS